MLLTKKLYMNSHISNQLQHAKSNLGVAILTIVFVSRLNDGPLALSNMLNGIEVQQCGHPGDEEP